jgi:hypothetical protein
MKSWQQTRQQTNEKYAVDGWPSSEDLNMSDRWLPKDQRMKETVNRR